MRIIDFPSTPITTVRYLSVRGRGCIMDTGLPIHHARVDRLPDGLAAVIATADLQGRQLFHEAAGGPLRLLGEVLPQRLADEVLPDVGVEGDADVAVLLAGDFYTVPNLEKRGGTGDVTDVWHAFGDCFAWVAGVAGNHDAFGAKREPVPSFPEGLYYLDGDTIELGSIRFGGVGGIIGNSRKHHRRAEEDYVRVLDRVLEQDVDVLLTHEGPDGTEPDQRGLPGIRTILERRYTGLVIRGHDHWDEPFAQFPGGLQVLNVDARVVILTL